MTQEETDARNRAALDATIDGIVWRRALGADDGAGQAFAELQRSLANEALAKARANTPQPTPQSTPAPQPAPSFLDRMKASMTAHPIAWGAGAATLVLIVGALLRRR